MKRRTLPTRALGILLGTALLTAACGSSSDSDSGSGSGSGGGGPITVAFIGSTESAVFSFPQSSEATRARIEAINAGGGINGRKIKFTTCNDKGDPNEAAVCVRQAVSDKAVAVIGGISTQGNPITSALEAANIIYTGERPLSPGELKSPISFPLVGGASSTAAGMGLHAGNDLKCTTAYALAGDVPANRSTSDAFVAGFKSATGQTPKVTVTPATTTDYAPAASSARAAKADCIFLSVSVPEMPKAIPAVRQANPDARILTTGGNFPPTIIKALGQSAEGILLSDSQIPVNTKDNATITQFQEEMKQYAPKTVPDPFALSSWFGTKVLAETIEGIDGDVTAASVKKAYEGLGEVDGGGVIGTFSFQDKSPVKDQPRQFNRTYVIYEVKDGTYAVTDPSFSDASDALS